MDKIFDIQEERKQQIHAFSNVYTIFYRVINKFGESLGGDACPSIGSGQVFFLDLFA